MSKFISEQLFSAKVGLISFMTLFNVAAGFSQEKQPKIVTQQPDKEITQLSADEPWQTAEYWNKISELNNKYGTKEKMRNGREVNRDINVGKGKAVKIIKTSKSKSKSDGEKIFTGVLEGIDGVSDMDVIGKDKNYKLSQDQIRYTREKQAIDLRFKRAYEKEQRADAKSTGADKVDQTYKKMYADYLTQCRKNKAPIQYKTQQEYVQALESAPASQTQTSTSKTKKLQR